MDFGSMILDAICDRAYQAGYKEGCTSENSVSKKMLRQAFHKGFQNGFVKGQYAMSNDMTTALEAASTVTKVVFDGDKTVVKFADGDYEIVHYNPDYGYPYDAEKAIMAGMLKHLVGGVYTRPLKANAEKIREMNQRSQKRCECKNDCECKNNISDEMICRDNMCKTDSLTDKVFRDPEGNVLNNMSEDDKFLYMLNSMEDDIFES